MVILHMFEFKHPILSVNLRRLIPGPQACIDVNDPSFDAHATTLKKVVLEV
jgi:hypothetical protein